MDKFYVVCGPIRKIVVANTFKEAAIKTFVELKNTGDIELGNSVYVDKRGFRDTIRHTELELNYREKGDNGKAERCFSTSAILKQSGWEVE